MGSSTSTKSDVAPLGETSHCETALEIASSTNGAVAMKARRPYFDVTTSLNMSAPPVAILGQPGGRSQHSSQVRYFTISSSSTSKTSVAPGLIFGGDPRRP